MADKISIKAEKRSVLGKRVKKLRRDGVIPANIFGKDVVSQAISINAIEFEKVYKKAGETQVVEVDLDKKMHPVLISNINFDPKTDRVLHVDFKQIDLTKKVSAEVPLELIGESPAEKEGKGTVVQLLNEILVEALPTDFPEKIEVSIDKMFEIDDQISVADLKVGDKLELLDDRSLVVCKVEELREEEPEPQPVAEETPEGEAEGETFGGEDKVVEKEGQENPEEKASE